MCVLKSLITIMTVQNSKEKKKKKKLTVQNLKEKKNPKNPRNYLMYLHNIVIVNPQLIEPIVDLYYAMLNSISSMNCHYICMSDIYTHLLTIL